MFKSNSYFLYGLLTLFASNLVGCLNISNCSNVLSSDCTEIQNIQIQLMDNHNVPIVSNDIRIFDPNLSIVPTNSEGQFSLSNIASNTQISGFIQNIQFPQNQYEVYVTALDLNTTAGQGLNSFGSLTNLNFGFQTVVLGDTATIIYPRVVHYECPSLWTYSGPVYLFAGPLIGAESIAQDFELASQANVCKVGIQAQFNGYNSSGPTTPGQIHIRLRADNSGIPGSIIADQITPGSAFINGADSSGNGIYLGSTNFVDFCTGGSAPVKLNSSQRYWIETALVGVDDSYNPLWQVIDNTSCAMPTGGLPLQKSTDGVSWSSVTLSDPGAQGSGTSQRTPIFLSE